MLRRIASIFLFILPAFYVSGQQAPVQPESFYVASYQQHEWTIIDVQPASIVDTRVRFIRAYPACGTYHVQETDYTFENVSVAELAGKAALCAPDKTVSRTVSSFKKKKHEEPEPDDRLGTFAQCSTTSVVHHLPSGNDLRYHQLQEEAEEIAALWNLERGILERYTKVTESVPFKRPIDEETRLKKQHLAEHAAIQIRNGDFDSVLPEGLGVEGPEWLSDLMPDPEKATGLEEDHGMVENIEQLGLEKTVPIPYPQMGKIAHIQGDVRIAIQIDPAAGTVISTTALSGHPFLQYHARESINSWIFSIHTRGRIRLKLSSILRASARP